MMSEKRYIVFPNNVVWDNKLGEVVGRCILEGIGDTENVCQRLNEQQATIDELEKNFDDLVKWASEIAKRNVVLDEKIGKIQQAIRIAYEKKPYPKIEDIQKEMENE